MLCGILTQPWWKRVWVIQEVLLSTSTESTLLHVGHYNVSLASCDNLNQHMNKHLRGCCKKWTSLIAGHSSVFNGLFDASNSVAKLLQQSANYRAGRFDLASAYGIYPSRQAADPHDYIYGFLGLLRDSPLNLEVDYEMPISQLYSAATGALLRRASGLEYLEAAVCFDPANRHQLPSWCIDWSKDIEADRIRQDRHLGLFDAAREHCQYDRLSNAWGGYPFPLVYRDQDIDSLLLGAAVESHVIGLSDLTIHMGVDLVDAVAKWMSAIRKNQSLLHDSEVILRVLTRDYWLHEFTGFRRTSPSYMDQLRQWNHFIGSNKRPPKEGILREIDNRMRRRPQRLFVTSSGRLAAGPPKMKDGDLVFLARGSEMPLLLRPCHEIATEIEQPPLYHQHPSYKLVGRCYVHGIMDGEAVTADTEWQTIRLC